MLDRPDPLPRLAQRGGYARLHAQYHKASYLSSLAIRHVVTLGNEQTRRGTGYGDWGTSSGGTLQRRDRN